MNIARSTQSTAVSDWANLPQELTSKFASAGSLEVKKKIARTCRPWRQPASDTVNAVRLPRPDLVPQQLPPLVICDGQLLSSIIKRFPHATSLDLSRCANITSEVMKHVANGLQNLQSLNLSSCRDLTHLPSEIWKLKQLTHLDLKDCRQLVELPKEIGNLTELRDLSLKGCTSLARFPIELGKLRKLERLNCSNIDKWDDLPVQLGSLPNLHDLDLSHSDNTELPDWVCNLSNLTHLKLDGAGWLETLPDAIGQLNTLEHLSLKTCGSQYGGLEELPETFTDLTNLRSLNLEQCSIYRMPEGFRKFSRLESLNMYLAGLEELPDWLHTLPSLRNLDIRACPDISTESINALATQRLDLDILSGD